MIDYLKEKAREKQLYIEYGIILAIESSLAILVINNIFSVIASMIN